MILDDAHEAEIDEENYFVSMTDMMVGLVFIFIIMLMYFAMQFQDVTDQLTGANKERTKILRQIEQALRKQGIEVKIDEKNGILRLPEAILFDSGRSELKESGKVAVGHLADALRTILPCYTDEKEGELVDRSQCTPTPFRIEAVYVEGHTDTDPYAGGGIVTDNLDLSVVRATNTFRQLVQKPQSARNQPDLEELCAQKGDRCEAVLSVSGYGEKRPVQVGVGDEQKRTNRRIDLRLLMVTPDAGSEVDRISSRLKQP